MNPKETPLAQRLWRSREVENEEPRLDRRWEGNKHVTDKGRRCKIDPIKEYSLGKGPPAGST